MRSRRSGGILLETALWMPFLILLFMGTVELSRITYTYYTLKKILYTVARTVGTQQGVNFCNDADTNVAAIKAAAVTGNAEGTGDPLLPRLTAELIAVRIERFSADSGTLSECTCEASATGCDTAGGARGPDYVVVTVPDGYAVTLRIPGLANDPIPLRPHVRLPFGGT